LSNIRKSGRFSYRPNKRHTYSRNNSYNKSVAKNNLPMLYDKYLKLAKEATSSGDRIQAEYYLQFADHYSRVMIENGIKSSETDTSKTVYKQSSENSNNKNEQESLDSFQESNKEFSEEKNNEEQSNDKDDKSLDEVSFIAKPIKSTNRSKK
tara:strand:+ start:1135 stop:1590 length:456 start_codon:yes stop_codon:yes gene_type:complete